MAGVHQALSMFNDDDMFGDELGDHSGSRRDSAGSLLQDGVITMTAGAGTGRGVRKKVATRPLGLCCLEAHTPLRRALFACVSFRPGFSFSQLACRHCSRPRRRDVRVHHASSRALAHRGRLRAPRFSSALLLGVPEPRPRSPAARSCARAAY